MRSRITKQQIKYLVDLLTHHIEDLPDDTGKWLTCLKLTYRELVTLDNMGIYELDDDATVITLDRIYQDLKNNFAKQSIWFPEDSKYYDRKVTKLNLNKGV